MNNKKALSSNVLRSFIIITFMMSVAPSHAGLLDTTTIRIANHTEHTVYCCFYHQRGATLTRTGDPFVLPEDNAVRVPLPGSRLLSTRVLAISALKTLPEVTSVENGPFLTTPVRVGMWEPTDFTVHPSRHTNKAKLSETKKWISIQERVKEYEAHTASFACANEQAEVSTQRIQDESDYLAQRRAHTKAAQEKLLGRKIKRPLRIGLCASGGGFRAMLATLGVLKGLKEKGILDAVDTFVGLSGSTWAALSWLASRKPIAQYADDITTRLQNGLMHSISTQYNDLARVKKEKEMCGLPVSAIDLYGIGLAHTLLRPEREDYLTLTLADTAVDLVPARHPLMVCTAVTRHTPADSYEWLSFSPFSVRQHVDNTQIPAWALNRLFCDGQSSNNTPPPLLGYCMGIFGSSFSISIRDIFDRAPEGFQRFANALLPASWHEQINSAGWANTKITAAYIPNFTYGMDTAGAHKHKWLCMVDGGYLNNMPLFPLLEQQEEPFDLVIVVDSKREHDQRITQVNQAYRRADKAGYRVAPLNEDAVLNDSVTISMASEKHDTSVVYMTLEPDEQIMPGFSPISMSCYMTPNLFYTPTQAQELVRFMYGVTLKHGDAITDALKEVAEKQSL